jgi:hypothetical protein
MKTFTSRMNSVASVLRRVLGGAVCAQTWSAVCLGLILLLGPSGASADIINNYVFAPGASTVLDGYVSAGFTFDASDVMKSVATLNSGKPQNGGHLQ